MLWACFRFPQLALDAVRVGRDANASARPFAVIDGPQQRRHVVIADAQAMRAGVHPGQPLAAAQMLCPRLAVTPRDEEAERQALETLATWAYRFSAEIHLCAPDSLRVEVGASLTLFGGWPALERRLRSEIAAHGFVFTLAAAPTASAASVLATHADGIAIPNAALLVNALGVVPIGSAGFDAKTVAALHGMGFRQLRDLFRLPRPELGKRIGQSALAHLDRMRGLLAEALPRFQPADRFERRIEFSFGVESQTALAFPLQRLIRELALFLTARDGGVQRFGLVLGHERGASTHIEVGLLAPQRDPASLFELARVRLERLELAAPVHALTLYADDLPPLCPLHRDLFDDHHREQLDWPALIERLRARLGDDALHGLRCVADHRPGRAWRFVPALTPGVEKAASAALPALAVDVVQTGQRNQTRNDRTRPFWLLRQPIALRGKPPRILAGPERIESGWWDEHDYRRDYYVVETRPGQRAWAYVEAGTLAHWTVHGWFA